MKKFNIIVIIICLILILANFYIHDIIQYERSKYNYASANSGIGVVFLLIISWIANSIISGILFLTTVIIGHKTEKITTQFTLLTIGSIIITFFIPFLMLGIFH